MQLHRSRLLNEWARLYRRGDLKSIQFRCVERQLAGDFGQFPAGTIDDGSLAGAISRTGRIVFT